MRITFYGAAQEVTGSMHMVEVNGQRILLDCGMFQGHRSETYTRNQNFPFDPKQVNTLVLSHAHIDHSGAIPNLVKQGYDGNIWCTPATRNLCAYMLMDSGHIQEQDVEYLNQKLARRGEPPVQPLYTQADAQAALGYFISLARHRRTNLAEGVDLTFYEAGHILGSAVVVLDIQERDSGKAWRLVFSGDLGRPDAPIIRSPEQLTDADILLIESTYGNRIHGTYADAQKQLRDIVRDTARRRGKLIIPAFALGRTQELLYALNQLDAAGDIPPLPIYVDSPLAVNITDVFRMHPEEWDEEVQRFLLVDHLRNPFQSEHMEYVRDVRRSKQLNYLNQPAIIISANGMAENGRILHHLKNGIDDPDNTVLFVGFQAENTLGRRLLDGAKEVRILGDEYRVRAKIASIDGYSAHADQKELLDWAASFNRQRLQEAFVVHGEPASAAALAEKLRESGVVNAVVPERCQAFEF